MEPENLDLENGLRAFALLSIIPLVAFALWSEYFGRHLDALMIKRPQYEREPELQKVRMTSLCVILFLVALFIGSAEIREAFPLLSQLVFGGSVLIQLGLQTWVERKILPLHKKEGDSSESSDGSEEESLNPRSAYRFRIDPRTLRPQHHSRPEGDDEPNQIIQPTQVTQALQPKLSPGTEAQESPSSRRSAQTSPLEDLPPDDLAAIAFRAILSWSLAGASYIFVLLSCVQLFGWTAAQLHFSNRMILLAMLFGGALGVICGVALNHLFGPLQMRHILPTLRTVDGATQTLLNRCFEQTGVRPLPVTVIDVHNLPIGATQLSGFKKAPGSFAQSLFISKIALILLSPSEFQALVLNQLCRLSLKHSKKRLLLSSALILITTSLSIASVLISEKFVASEIALNIVGPAVALLAFYSSFHFLSRQSDQQEFEADVYTIRQLGVNFEDFCNGLKKMDFARINEFENERRIQVLEQYLKENPVPKTDQGEAGKAA